MLQIATWNVNSIKIRLPLVLEWLDQHKIDILFLQEIKCTNDNFPLSAFEEAGYHCLVAGQLAYNGVAIISREKLTLVSVTLEGDQADVQARYLEALYQDWRLVNIYAPNGNPVSTEKFSYKMAWMARLETRIKTLLADREKFLVAGDFNIIPQPMDARHPEQWQNDALFQPESRSVWRRLLNLGLIDAFRALYPQDNNAFSFWDYQAGAWQQDDGIRIDHLLLSPKAADTLVDCKIDREPRNRERPSDHTPVVGVFTA